MSAPLQTKSVIAPRLADVLLNLKLDIFASLNCCMPGIIQSFNATSCTCVVQPVFNRKLPDGTVKARPVLADCPVYFPGGGGGRLTFPVKAGDQCLIVFQDRRIDEWFQSGAQSLPADVRMHDLSDGIVIVGLDPTGAQGPVPTNMVELSYQGTKFQLTSTGWNFVGTGGAEIDLTGAIVTIKNATTTLLTQINALITAIEAIQVTGNLPLTAPSVAALQAIKIQMATLLG
jgi:hypothetical protein